MWRNLVAVPGETSEVIAEASFAPAPPVEISWRCFTVDVWELNEHMLSSDNTSYDVIRNTKSLQKREEDSNEDYLYKKV